MSRLSPLLESITRASAAPAVVRVVFERLAEGGMAEQLEDADVARSLAAVAAASRSLGRFLVAEPAALSLIAAPRWEGLGEVTDAAGLASAQRLAFLQIARDDLTGLLDLSEVGEALASLADSVFDAAFRLVGPGVGLAVVAMGKHGARELNYASDVDVVFVADDGEDLERATRAAQDVLALVRNSYRVDVDLRPEGRNGALVRTLSSYRAYWDAWARPWEFQALLKARPCAGPSMLKERFAAAASDAVWSRRLDADDLAELRSMKARAEAAVTARGLADRELKRGRGGIRDVEFAIQLLQLVHGGSDQALRRPATLAALAELAGGYVDPGDAAALALAYRFLRTVEHRLQLVEEAQVHTLPPAGPARDHLARVVGFSDAGADRRAGRFDTVLGQYQATVRSIHERLFFRPLLEAFSSAPAVRLSAAAEGERLAAFGFHDVERTRQALDELTRGLTRSSALMGQLLPVLLGWLSETPDPDLGLLGLRNLAGLKHQRGVLVGAFRDSPEFARRLCVVLGTSRRLGELVTRHPALALRLGENAELVPREGRDLVARALAAVGGEEERAGRRLRVLVSEETLRLAAGELVAGLPPVAVARGLADLGDAALTGALAASRPGLPFAVVAMGRLGGAELSYGSDLDVLFVYDGAGPDDADEAERVASFVLSTMNGRTPADRIWTLDPSLRPEGRGGRLARSMAAYEEYHSRWLSPWERQALVRARPVTGDSHVIESFMSLVRRSVLEHDLNEDDLREIRRLKARMEKERIPAGEDPQFHFKLGRGSLADIEWTVQLLQLARHVGGTNTMRAIDDLLEAGALGRDEAAVLSEALVYLERTRNRWHLVGNYVAGAGGPVGHQGSDSLPSAKEALGRLARSLGETPTSLREQYRRTTRRARRVVERRFYGL